MIKSEDFIKLRKNDSKIQNLTKECDYISYCFEKKKKSNIQDTDFKQMQSRMEGLERTIREHLVNYVEEKVEVIEKINAIENENYSTLLYKRYVEFKDFRTISEEMQYSYQYIIEMHSKALKLYTTTYANQ